MPNGLISNPCCPSLLNADVRPKTAVVSSTPILDSQSVKSAGHHDAVGYDAAKQIKGRKRHLLVDTLGLVLGVAVTPANVPERAEAWIYIATIRIQLRRLA